MMHQCTISRFALRLFGLPLLALLALGSSCSAQGKPEKKKERRHVIAQKGESLKDISEIEEIELGLLRQYNPALKGALHANDTVFLEPPLEGTHAEQPKTDQSETPLKEPVGTNKLFSRVTFYGKRYFHCEIDPDKYRIESFNKRDSDQNPHTFASLRQVRQKDLLFAVNGGMFEPDLSPVGLFVSNGQTSKQVNNRKEGTGNYYEIQPNGIFLIDTKDKAQVITGDSYQEGRKLKVATQSGPMLVVNGKINDNFRKGSPNLKIRNGVGVNKEGNVIFLVSEAPVNFYELAELFQKLECNNALYLDGVVSQYYAPEIRPEPLQSQQLGVFITVSRKESQKETREYIQPANDEAKPEAPKKATTEPAKPATEQPKGGQPKTSPAQPGATNPPADTKAVPAKAGANVPAGKTDPKVPAAKTTPKGNPAKADLKAAPAKGATPQKPAAVMPKKDTAKRSVKL
ncbi:phosphodiester glycosidase family protein [Flaviaesturariibacter amylovorans]|uniref:Phosphodiester glycosidase domain-containing protein n=1 Tax=Flaviaesturariibacter amylovorans TaxID=1084520 RepID=A0ABP8G7S9_9BACT